MLNRLQMLQMEFNYHSSKIFKQFLGIKMFLKISMINCKIELKISGVAVKSIHQNSKPPTINPMTTDPPTQRLAIIYLR